MVTILQDQSTDRVVPLLERKLKVCHVTLTLCTGGLERLLVEFARFHSRHEFELEVVVLGDAGRLADEIRLLGCEVIELNCLHLSKLRQVRLLAELFKTRGVDIVHTHNAYPHIYGSLAARKAGVDAIIHTRHGRRFGHTFKERLYFAAASRLANKIVPVSDDTGVRCQKTGWLEEQKVQRIWNGIDLERFTFREVTLEPKAISVGRLSAEKDYEMLLLATALVVKERPDFQLTLVGDGRERGALAQLTQAFNLTDNVTFTGERSDIPELLAEHGFYICSSKTEGISLTILEAMAVGLPVLATDVGGNPEIVVPEETGRLVIKEEPEVMAQEILKMCDQTGRRREMGRNGRARVEQNFDIRGMVDEYEHLYLDVLFPIDETSTEREIG